MPWWNAAAEASETAQQRAKWQVQSVQQHRSCSSRDESPLEQCAGLSGDLAVRAEKGIWSRAALFPPPAAHDDMQLVISVLHNNKNYKNKVLLPVKGWQGGGGRRGVKREGGGGGEMGRGDRGKDGGRETDKRVVERGQSGDGREGNDEDN